jgi:hypothetical protein
MPRHLSIVALTAMLLVSCAEPPEPLNASVQFTGTQFIVKNHAGSEWTDVSIEVNRPDGYSARVRRLDGGASEAIGAMLFAKEDGTRFNPVQTKPQNVWVRANVSGSSKLYIGHFN